MVDKLTDRYRAFCKEYVVTHNASASARSAGYSVKCAAGVGYKLLQRADIKREIERLEAKTQSIGDSSAILDVKRVLLELSAIATDENASRSDRIRALDLLGRRYALWTDRTETVIDVSEPVSRLSDGDLRALVESARQAVALDVTPDGDSP